MYSLSLLFLTLPLYFSHIFMQFGIVIGDGISFERQKMYLFLLVISIALAEMILTRHEGVIAGLKKYGCIILGLLLLPLVPILLYGGEIDTSWIRGSYEKFHGYLLYIGVIVLGFSLSLLSLGEKRKLINLSLISAGLVSFFALLESLGLLVFFPTQLGGWGPGLRTVSTMGNPNYLAGYLLICLPLVSYIRVPERYLLAGLISVALITTQSYIGIGIALLYGLYLMMRVLLVYTHLKNQIQHILLWGSLVTVVLIAIIASMMLLPPDKLLSLTSRFVLMRESLSGLFSYPLGLITGYGPEGILRYFSGTRSALIDAYFPAKSLIDSSHNVFIDIVFQYGLIPLGLLGAYLYKNWNTWNPHARASWMLGMAFLMFNPYVVVHLMFLTLTFSLHDNRD